MKNSDISELKATIDTSSLVWTVDCLWHLGGRHTFYSRISSPIVSAILLLLATK